MFYSCSLFPSVIYTNSTQNKENYPFVCLFMLRNHYLFSWYQCCIAYTRRSWRIYHLINLDDKTTCQLLLRFLDDRNTCQLLLRFLDDKNTCQLLLRFLDDKTTCQLLLRFLDDKTTCQLLLRFLDDKNICQLLLRFLDDKNNCQLLLRFLVWVWIVGAPHPLSRVYLCVESFKNKMLSTCF